MRRPRPTRGLSRQERKKIHHSHRTLIKLYTWSVLNRLGCTECLGLQDAFRPWTVQPPTADLSPSSTTSLQIAKQGRGDKNQCDSQLLPYANISEHLQAYTEYFCSTDSFHPTFGSCWHETGPLFNVYSVFTSHTTKWRHSGI